MESKKTDNNWRKLVSKYNGSEPLKSWWQLINSVLPFLALWVALYYSLEVSYWLTLALSIPTAGFMTRIFIIFHDCGHGSFFKSQRLNKIVGAITGAMVFTPYKKWHYLHKVHHQTVGDLDKRGIGDINTLTVEEYKALPKFKKLYYRLYRNPIILFLIAPFFLFTLQNRMPNKELSKDININTHLTTLAIILAITGISLWIGFTNYLLIQIPILYFASVFGVWLFYVQHQFEDVVWERSENWEYKRVALEGSSFLKFPKVLQWFSGNIGFHHIHHLSPRIPNYNLEKCYNENPSFQKKALGIIDGLKTIRFQLWDEKNYRLVSFREVKTL